MRIFLDFDGVLHPKKKQGEPPSEIPNFAFVAGLARVLEPFQEVEIVISSTWREGFTMSELRKMLGPLGRRVVGRTGEDCETRFEEISEALADYTGPWIAIDDDDTGWPRKHQEKLLKCHPDLGLGDATRMQALEAMLLAQLGQRDWAV